MVIDNELNCGKYNTHSTEQNVWRKNNLIEK